MADAIGASAGFGLSRSGLDAELARYKKQLADCINCPATSSSLQGKAVIQDLSNKITGDQQTLRRMASTSAPGQNVAVTPADEVNTYTATGADDTSGASPGGRLNVYA